MEHNAEDFDQEYLRLSEELEIVVEEKAKIVLREKAIRHSLEVLRRARIHSKNGETIPVSQEKAANFSIPAKVVAREPMITDHAMVRFLERHYDFDFDTMKKSLLTDTLKMACRMGAQSVKAHGGRWTIRGGVVTTFLKGPRTSPKGAGPRVSKAQRLPRIQTMR